jgi:hypothetical protein
MASVFGRSRRRREPTQRDLALQGVVFVIVVVLLGALLSMKLKGEFGDTIPVTAEVQNAGGSLKSGVDVKLRGMAVGKVGRLTAERGHVIVDLNIERRHARRIPRFRHLLRRPHHPGGHGRRTAAAAWRRRPAGLVTGHGRVADRTGQHRPTGRCARPE